MFNVQYLQGNLLISILIVNLLISSWILTIWTHWSVTTAWSFWIRRIKTLLANNFIAQIS